MHVTACFTCTIFRREIQNCQQGLMKQISACGTLDHMRFIQQILTDTHVCVYLSLCCLSFDISFCSLLNTHTKSLKETVLQIMKISSNVTFSNNSETVESLPWSGVPHSAHVSGASEGMDEWVRMEPRRWRW